jgi:nucleoside-diphosphate-sugar epimerase
MLKELATVIAGIAGSKVVFQLPDEREARGYSKATKALLDISKIRKLGWTPSCTIEVGLERTLSIRRDLL